MMPALPEPEVSVVIPTRNRWVILRRTLRTVLAQRDVAFEVIVVDDGSDHGPPEGMAGLDDPRVRVVALERSLGPAGARNAGVEVAGGTWLAFLDDDDVWAPDKLRRQLDEAARTGATFVYVGAVRVDAHLNVLSVDGRLPGPDEIAECLLSTNPMPGGGSGPIVRADLMRSLGGFDEQLRHMADWDLWIRVTHAAPAAVLREHLVGYVIHAGSMGLGAGHEFAADFHYMEQKHGALARAHGRRLNRLEFERWMAMLEWRAGRRGRAARELLTELVRDAHPANHALVVDQLRRRARRAIRREAVPEPAWLALYR